MRELTEQEKVQLIIAELKSEIAATGYQTFAFFEFKEEEKKSPAALIKVLSALKKQLQHVQGDPMQLTGVEIALQTAIGKAECLLPVSPIAALSENPPQPVETQTRANIEASSFSNEFCFFHSPKHYLGAGTSAAVGTTATLTYAGFAAAVFLGGASAAILPIGLIIAAALAIIALALLVGTIVSACTKTQTYIA